MILHIDLNSFFARVEQQANPALRGQPIGILGKGHQGARTCVCAASPEAKRSGIKSGLSVREAQALCPSLILVPPDYPKYLDISRRFMTILEKFSPWVEIFSIDEAFLALKRQNPQSPNDKILNKNKDLEIRNLKLGITEAAIQEAIFVAQLIKSRLKRELGDQITASVGIAWGKVFAKLAGELQKPDGLVVLDKATWLTRVGEMNASEICGIGYRLAEHLRLMGITTIRDLSRADAGRLVARFGPAVGMRLWQIGQGIDNAPVSPSTDLDPPKSIGHQVTLDRSAPWRTTYPTFVKLTQKVGRRLRRAGLEAHRLSLHVSFENGGWGDTERHRPAIRDDAALLASLRSLWQAAPVAPFTRALRLGVVVSDLQVTGQQTLPLFPKSVIGEKITASLDAVRDRYGEASIEWGSGFTAELGNLRDWRGPRAVLDQ